MLIDTEKLKELVNEEFDRQGEIADKIKSDSRAIKLLTRIETAQIKALEMIEQIESLANKFNYTGEKQ